MALSKIYCSLEIYFIKGKNVSLNCYSYPTIYFSTDLLGEPIVNISFMAQSGGYKGYQYPFKNIIKFEVI